MIEVKLVQNFYDEFSCRQLKVGVNKRHEAILYYLKRCGLGRDNNVLEIGCGVGTLSGLLLKYLKKGWLLSIDLSPRSIEIAKKNLSRFENVKFLSVDITEWDTNQKFDVIVLPDVLEHIPIEYHKDVFRKLKSLLKEAGFVLIHIPNPYHLDYCREAGMPMQVVDQALYLPELLENLKDSGLYISYLEIYSIWQKEGDYQVIVLKHEERFEKFNPIIKKTSFWKKVLQKIQFEIRKIKK